MSANTPVPVKLDQCGRAYSESTDDNYHGHACWPPGPKILPGTQYVSRLEDPSIMALANRVDLDSELDMSLQTAQAICSMDANKAHCEDLNIFVRMRPGLTFEIPTKEAIWKMKDSKKWSHAQFQEHVEWQRYMRQSKPAPTDAPPQPVEENPQPAATTEPTATTEPAAITEPAATTEPAPNPAPDDIEDTLLSQIGMCHPSEERSEIRNPFFEWLCFTSRVSAKIRKWVKGEKTVIPETIATSANTATNTAAATSTPTAAAAG
ncbi:hypothetical protein [Bordetella sp. LUAb4]|uniref:hypothetical protein n=1 Tax=Bordetella sp. LUAb4 TaxID=2843195 RepID=UPI001E590D61|nr:hypothetical protein [Bordetella sp. LUAb4]